MSFLAQYRDIAESFLEGYGFEPDNHETLLHELEQAMGEAVIEAGYQVLREYGLGWLLEGHQQPPVPGSNPPGDAA